MAYGHFEGDLHIDLDTLYDQHSLIPKDKPVIVYCDTGAKGYNAERILRSMGYEVYQLDGGYHIYQKGKGK